MKKKKKSIRADFSEIKKIINHLANENRYTEALQLAVPMYTSLRASEYKTLTWKHLMDGDNIRMFITKQKKWRTVTNPTNLKILAMEAYHGMGLANKNQLIFKGKRGPITKGKPMSTKGLNDRIEALCQEFGLDHYTNHSFRKSWGYEMYIKLGANHEALLYVQEAFGHSNPKTTIIYLGLSEEKIHKAALDL